ncbi:MAG: carboxypeptidase regulatory-like domain-containing protein [Candidatus Baltobacteraceae bacterium]
MRAFRSLGFVLIAAALLAGCGGPSVPAAEQYGTIAGVVVDASTNGPIAGATVCVNTVSCAAATDSSGKFSIGNLPNGPYDLTATAAQYNSYGGPAASGNLSPNQTLTVTLALSHK